MSRGALAPALAFLALAGLAFGARQNADPTLGGAIAPPAAAWLVLALAAIFVVPLAFWRDPAVAPALRRLYGAHLAFWALRAAIELPLMYHWQAWIPPYGIAHDLAGIALVLGLAWHGRAAIGSAEAPARRFLPVLVLALAAEAALAGMFHHATAGRTATLWFADLSARFTALNVATTAAVLIVGAMGARVVAAYLRGDHGEA